MSQVVPLFPTLAIPTDYRTHDAWLAGRKNGIGASDAAGAFFEGYKQQSPCSIAMDKMGIAETGPEECEALEIGSAMQSGVLELARKRIGLELVSPGEFTIYRHPHFPWMCASLDSACLEHNDGPAPVEAKYIGNLRAAKDWSDDSEPVLKFDVQCQHQMAVMGWSHAYLVGLIGSKLVVKHIERNDRFIDQALIPQLAKLWKLIEEGRAAIAAGETPRLPEIDGSAATARALALLYPDDNGEEIFLTDPALVQSATDLAGAKEKIKELEALETAAKNQLMAAIGNASFAVLADGRKFSHKQQTRKEYVCKASTFRVLRSIR